MDFAIKLATRRAEQWLQTVVISTTLSCQRPRAALPGGPSDGPATTKRAGCSRSRNGPNRRTLMVIEETPHGSATIAGTANMAAVPFRLPSLPASASVSSSPAIAIPPSSSLPHPPLARGRMIVWGVNPPSTGLGHGSEIGKAAGGNLGEVRFGCGGGLGGGLGNQAGLGPLRDRGSGL
ncbi:MAG: hypothetical protein M1812_003425 [Candelaria pacifica]|nr:MAG: hypothetical protein M1812_003425 [Candelaria pacifica]